MKQVTLRELHEISNKANNIIPWCSCSSMSSRVTRLNFRSSHQIKYGVNIRLIHVIQHLIENSVFKHELFHNTDCHNQNLQGIWYIARENSNGADWQENNQQIIFFYKPKTQSSFNKMSFQGT